MSVLFCFRFLAENPPRKLFLKIWYANIWYAKQTSMLKSRYAKIRYAKNTYRPKCRQTYGPKCQNSYRPELGSWTHGHGPGPMGPGPYVQVTKLWPICILAFEAHKYSEFLAQKYFDIWAR